MSLEEGTPFTMPVTPAYSGYGNGMFDGNGFWWIVIFLLLGGWGNGFGWNNGGNAAMQGAITRGDLCMDMSFQEVKDGVRTANDTLNVGFANLNNALCNQSYDTARMIDALNVSNLQTANAQNLAAVQNANAIQAQLASCCCEQKSATENVRFTIAQEECATRNQMQANTRDIIENANANTRAILDKITAQEIAAKDAQIAAQNQKIFGLELSASQAEQNAYLINQLRPFPSASYTVPNPFTGTYGYGYNNGCGCGC